MVAEQRKVAETQIGRFCTLINCVLQKSTRQTLAGVRELGWSSLLTHRLYARYVDTGDAARPNLRKIGYLHKLYIIALLLENPAVGTIIHTLSLMQICLPSNQKNILSKVRVRA